MADAISVSAPISGTDRTLSFETGKLAHLADGAVVARIGDTVLLATATAARSVREGTDFFPLTVDIEERTYAAGKIPGSFFRREGKASDQAILTCRLIDRPLRPSFPEGFRNEVHVVGTIFGADQVNPHDVLAINARLGRPHALGHPLRRPDRRRADRLHDRGHLDPAPHLPGGRRVDLRAGGGRPGADRGRRRRDRHHDGRGRRHRALVGVLRGGRAQGDRGGPGRRASRRPRPGSASRSTSSASWWRPTPRPAGPSRPSRSRTFTDYGDDVYARVEAVGTEPIAKANTITDKAERNAALDEAGEDIIAALGRRVPRPAGRDQGGRPLAHQEAGAQADRRGGRPHRRPGHRGHPAAVGRGRPVPDGARLGPVPAGRDPGAERHHPRHAPHEPDARHHQPGRVQALHAPLQLPALLDRRDRLHARAQAPGDRPRPAGRAGPAAGGAQRRGVPLHAAPGLRRPGVQRVDVDGLGLRLDAVAHGRRACPSRRRWPASPWASSTTAAPTSP